MASAERRISTAKGSKGKVTWRVRYLKPDGSRGSETGFSTKRTALAWGEEQEAAIRAGRWIDPDLQRKTFGEFARYFMAQRRKRGATDSKRWDLLDQHILPKWEHVPLNQITWFDVDGWAQRLSCAETTAGHTVSLMSTILTAAVDARHLAVNPLFGRRRTSKAATIPAASEELGAEEAWFDPPAVIRVAHRLGPANGMHVLTTAFTGINWGEGLALSPASLRNRQQPHDGGVFTCPVLRVSQEVAEYRERGDDGARLGTVLRLEPTKNAHRIRDIDVPPFLDHLVGWHVECNPHLEWLFCTRSGQWWRRSNWGKVLRPAADGRPERARRQGVAYREAWEPLAAGLTMRKLRHFHDTCQEQIGVRDALAYEQAGHKRPGIKAVYQHPTPAMRQERLDGLQGIFEKALSHASLPADSWIWQALADRSDGALALSL
ncbi:hypothetical protein ACWGNE_02120 [Streptomyces xiamenensis]